MMLELWCREVLDTAGHVSSDRIARAPNVGTAELALSPGFDRGGDA